MECRQGDNKFGKLNEIGCECTGLWEFGKPGNQNQSSVSDLYFCPAPIEESVI